MNRDPILIPLVGGLLAFGIAIGAVACSSDSKVTYASCADVEAAGKAPLHKGDPGYSAKLDRDGDGTACDASAPAAAKMTFAECQKSAEYPGGKYAVSFDNGVCTVQKP